MAPTDPEVEHVQSIVDGLAPVVCTLGLDERPGRRLEWADLGALSLTTDRVDGGVVATFPIGLADVVEDLALRENSCCGSWLMTSTERRGDTVRLEITTENPEGLTVILSMADSA